MDLEAFERDWAVTPEKMEELVRRIVAQADPLQIILFGSRARGEHRQNSDVDVAVVLDAPEEEVHLRLPYTVTSGIRMPIDMIVVSREKYDRHRPWLNSVFNYIDQEGIVLYDRADPERSCSAALQLSAAG